MAGCSISTIANILMYHHMYGTLTPPFQHYMGWPCLLDQEDYAYIDTLLDQEPTIYLDEIQDKLMEDHDIDVSITSIQQAVVHLDFT